MNLGGHSSLSVSVFEQVLVDLAQWMARAQQYSIAHPTAKALGDKTHATLMRALSEVSPIEYGILREDVSIGNVLAIHPQVRTRVAPYLHERGVLVLRFLAGVPREELTTLVDALIRTPQQLFDAGGLVRLVLERGIARIQVEELSHEISEEEREEHRRRKDLKTFFAEMLRSLLAKRSLELDAARLAELLEHPDVAVAILEEESRGGIAEGVAGLALLVRQMQPKTEVDLAPKLRDVMTRLSPESRERVVIGLPALVGDFRAALIWAFSGFADNDLARFTFPAFRMHAGELDATLYSMSVIAPRDLARLAILRRVAMMLFDLPEEEAGPVFEHLDKPTPEFDSFRAERDMLHDAAVRASAMRTALRVPVPTDSAKNAAAKQRAGSAGSRSVADLVVTATMAPWFPKLCDRLPTAATLLAEHGHGEAAIAILKELSDMHGVHERVAAKAAEAIASSKAVPRMLNALEAVAASAEENELVGLGAAAQVLVRQSPNAVCDYLETCENRKLRRILVDALPLAGPQLLPLARARLSSPQWFVVRNFTQLLGRAGGTPRDLVPIARHPNEKVRLEVLRALRAMPADDDTVEIALIHMTDASQEIRQGARSLLRSEGVMPGAAAVRRLERVASDDGQQEEVRLTAVFALGRSDLDGAAEALFRIMQPQGLLEGGAASAVREAAATALHGSRAKAAKRLFENGLTSSVWRVKKACERASRGA